MNIYIFQNIQSKKYTVSIHTVCQSSFEKCEQKLKHKVTVKNKKKERKMGHNSWQTTTTQSSKKYVRDLKTL